MTALALVDKPGTDAERRARGAILFGPFHALLEAAIAAERAAIAETGRDPAPRMRGWDDWPARLAASQRADRAARQRAFANLRESEPAVDWEARHCPMVGSRCITRECVCWVGTDVAGFCAQIAAMRHQLEERSAPCS